MKERTKKTDARKPASIKSKPGSTTGVVSSRKFAQAGAVRKINPKWAWHYRVLLAARDRLMEERGERLSEAAQLLEPHSMDMADSASDEFDHDLALAELSAEQDALYEVDAALKRLLNGTYGLCEESGEAIPAARLRAIPWARFTRGVAERLEKKGMLRRAHLNQASTVRGEGRIRLEPEAEAEEAGEVPPRSLRRRTKS